MSCSAKKNKKNLDSTHLAPTFREQWGQSPVLSPYLCILILSHIFHDFFVLWSGWVICHTKDPYIFKDEWTWWLLACVNGLCTGNMPMQDVPLLLPAPPWTLGRWGGNLQCSFWAVAMHILLCKTHVVMFKKNKICIPSSAANHCIWYPPSATLVQGQVVSGSLVPVDILQHGF
jgi:hypothetical protein